MLVSILSRQLDFVSTLWTSNDLKSGKVFYTKILFEKCMFQVLNDKLLYWFSHRLMHPTLYPSLGNYIVF